MQGALHGFSVTCSRVQGFVDAFQLYAESEKTVEQALTFHNEGLLSGRKVIVRNKKDRRRSRSEFIEDEDGGSGDEDNNDKNDYVNDAKEGEQEAYSTPSEMLQVRMTSL